jgi:hypothetical protein
MLKINFFIVLTVVTAILFSIEGNAQTWNSPANAASSTTPATNTWFGVTGGSTKIGNGYETSNIVFQNKNSGFPYGVGQTGSFLQNASSSTSSTIVPNTRVNILDWGPFIGQGFINASQYVSGAWKTYFLVGGNGTTYIGDNSGSTASPSSLVVNGWAQIGDPSVSKPTGCNLFVSSGTVSFNGSTMIGSTTIPTNAPASGAYKFFLSGNANVNGSVVIGDASTFTATTPFPTTYNLYVANGILTEKVKVAVKTTTDWSDFVFEKNYKLTPLKELEVFINKNKHLPGIPSAQDVVDNGINVAEMDAKLLMKIEELTLYMIEMKKENEILKKDIEELKKK